MLHSTRFWPVLGALAVLFASPSGAAAQQRPTPQQAEALLRARPELVEQLRQRIIRSGMSADDVRARLRAEGYPENILDPYLPGGSGAPSDSLSSDVIEAMKALGVSDTTDVSPSEIRRLRDESERRRILRERPRDLLPDSLRDSLDLDVPIFGLDVFENATSQFDPNLAGPVDGSYRVGPGDRLMLILSGQVEAAYSLDVTREGFIVVPQVGRIDVANLTLDQLQNVLYDRLGRVYSEIHRGAGARTRFSISPVRLRTNQVFVVGDVEQPGSYRISAAGTVLSALYAAGGPTESGTLREIVVRRGGRAAVSMDAYDYLLRGDATNDVRLENGDVVFVGVHGPRVRVVGEVTRPAIYEMKPNETLADVVRAAGGLTALASRQRIQIERLAPGRTSQEAGHERFVLDVGLIQSASGSAVPPAPLQNGDIVRVFGISDRLRNRVVVAGNVWRPGRVAFTPGMRLSDALRAAGGVKPDVYTGQVAINRLRSDSSRSRVYSAFRDSSGALLEDVPLQEDDEIRVFSITEFRQERWVNVDGAVRRPGRYAYREGMSLRDVVMQAGGLHERALLTEAELARMPSDRSGGRLAVSTRVPLDSTYLFERGPDGTYLGPPGIQAPTAKAPEVTLRAYDNVLILEQPDWDLPRRATIVGEVRLPGTYTLISKQERLTDLIRRAGGLTDQAYAAGVSLVRTRDSIGRIGIDLPRSMRNPRFRDNLLMEDGDSIYIPPFRATVVVTGEVNSPVAVSYVPGRDIDWYIDAAGGPTVKADASRAWVEQPNGSIQSKRVRVMSPDGLPEPQPGSTVTVPAKDPNARTDRLQVLSSVVQVLASLVAIIAIAAR